jgi:TonB family protein
MSRKNLWSQWFWPLFGNHLWHTTLFTLIAWPAAVLLLRSSPARARYSVWLLTLAKFLLPSVFLIFAGASRATGNNLKGRIKNMLDRSNFGPISKKERMLAIVTFSMLIVVGGGMVLLTRDSVRAQNRGRKQTESQIKVPGGVPGGVSVGVSGGVPGGVSERIGVDSVNGSSTPQDRVRPKILYKEKADYTQEARDRRIEGKVILEVVFQADGKITGIKVIQGLPSGLTEKAIEAAQKIRFEPAMKDGVPVNTRGKVDYHFSLSKKPRRG